MSKEEQKSAGNEPDLETLRGWIGELDVQIRENEQLLNECRSHKEGSFRAELEEKLKSELIEQRHTRLEYAKLLREENLKRKNQQPEP